MRNYNPNDRIYDLYHFYAYMKELDGNKMNLKDIRDWQIARNIYSAEIAYVPITEAILDTWNRAHSYKEQLLASQDKLHRRNMLIMNLKTRFTARVKELQTVCDNYFKEICELKKKLIEEKRKNNDLKEWAELGKQFYNVMTGYRYDSFCPLDLMKKADELSSKE